jgi:hypothetical protein
MKRHHFVAFGPSVPIVPYGDFSSMPITREQFADLWWLCGPSAARNMLRLELWQVIASAYFEGLIHGAGMEREKHERTEQPTG